VAFYRLKSLLRDEEIEKRLSARRLIIIEAPEL